MGGEAPAAGGPPPSAPHPLTLRVLFAPFPVLFFFLCPRQRHYLRLLNMVSASMI